jgi:hypothetical protein
MATQLQNQEQTNLIKDIADNIEVDTAKLRSIINAHLMDANMKANVLLAIDAYDAFRGLR